MTRGEGIVWNEAKPPQSDRCKCQKWHSSVVMCGLSQDHNLYFVINIFYLTCGGGGEWGKNFGGGNFGELTPGLLERKKLKATYFSPRRGCRTVLKFCTVWGKKKNPQLFGTPLATFKGTAQLLLRYKSFTPPSETCAQKISLILNEIWNAFCMIWDFNFWWILAAVNSSRCDIVTPYVRTLVHLSPYFTILH